MCSHANLPPCRTIKVYDDKDDGTGTSGGTDFRSLRVSYDTRNVVVELEFHTVPSSTDLGDFVYLYGANRDVIRFSFSDNFYVDRYNVGNGHFDERVYSGKKQEYEGGRFVLFKIPLEKMPDIAEKGVWAYAMTSRDRIPDSGSATFPPVETCCDAPAEENPLAIETEIWLDTVLTNGAFEMSGVDAQLKLVDVRMDTPEYEYDSEEDIEGILSSLVSRKSGLQLEESGADVVAYLVDKHYTLTGENSAYDASEGFFVVTRDAKRQYEFVHAIGRLLGLGHENAFCHTEHNNRGPDVPCFKTKMGDADNCQCSDGTVGEYIPRVLLFSTSNRNYSGITVHDGATGTKSSVDRIRETLPNLFQRPSTSKTWVGPDLAELAGDNKFIFA